jgi:hypothetical protein
MAAPSRAELEQALLDLRQSAERLKSYAPERAEQLRRSVEARMAVLGDGAGLPADARARCALLVQQCAAVLECIGRAERYPAQIGARADVVYRSARLAHLARDVLDKIASPTTTLH